MILSSNKKVRYFLVGLLAMLLGFNFNMVSAHQYTNYFGIHMTTDEYFTLLNLGFTDDEIYYMDEDTFNNNKDLDAELVAQTKKYYKIVTPMYGASYVVEITPQEYLNQSQNQLLNTVTTQFITESSSISANGNKYRYKNTVVWLSPPQNKSFDVIGIGFINSVYIDSMIFYKHTYADANGDWHNSTLYYGMTNNSTGAGVVYKLPDPFYGLSATIYFDVSKNTTDTLQYIDMCGDYAHSLQTVTQYQAVDHVLNSYGIQFDVSVIDYFDEIPCAYSTALVNW